MGTRRRRFSREFKLEAVGTVAGRRHSLAQVARELDQRPDMLRRWKRQVEQDGEQAFPGHGRLKPGGGGIYNFDNAILESSTIARNSGPAVRNHPNGLLELADSIVPPSQR